jgi:hypothetical protein
MSSVEPQIGNGKRSNLNAPERLRRSLDRTQDRRANHCWVCDCKAVSGTRLTLHPLPDPCNQMCQRLTAVGRGIHVCQPIGQSLGIVGLDIVDLLTLPCPVMHVTKINGNRRFKTQRLRCLLRPALRATPDVLRAGSDPSNGRDSLNLALD